MVTYFHRYTAMDEPNIQSEVDRYIAWPGQALAYKLGQLEILKLRDSARQKLGDKFDIRTFHDEVLANGALPLDVLDAEVTKWIGDQARAPRPSVAIGPSSNRSCCLQCSTFYFLSSVFFGVLRCSSVFFGVLRCSWSFAAPASAPTRYPLAARSRPVCSKTRAGQMDRSAPRSRSSTLHSQLSRSL